MTTLRLDDGTSVVSVAGEVDLYTAPELERELLGAARNGAASLIVDLGECSFIDSTALGVLIEANRRLDGSARSLVLVSDDRNIRKVFEVTGLDRVFTICRSRAEALNQRPRA
ncbi:MAG: STAS domain-containing protein [Vicinamibacteria bacterium]